MFFISFIAGLISCLTPLVFPYLFICSIIFSQLSSSKRQHLYKVLIFFVLIISIYFILSFLVIQPDFKNNVKIHDDNAITIISSATLIFSLWLIGLLKGNTITNSLFKWLGLIVISTLVAASSISSSGPILGSLIAREQGKSQEVMTTMLVGYSIGVTVPFVGILLLSWLYYPKIKYKNWWNIVVKTLGVLIILTSSIQLMFSL